jgi:hypothetical protein
MAVTLENNFADHNRREYLDFVGNHNNTEVVDNFQSQHKEKVVDTSEECFK